MIVEGEAPGERLRRLILDWTAFHAFTDDCRYPLISPSDVVMDDLLFRLTASGEPHEIDSKSRAQWAQIPPCKGKERRLRRPETELTEQLKEAEGES
jgi:hypothetical protein